MYVRNLSSVFSSRSEQAFGFKQCINRLRTIDFSRGQSKLSAFTYNCLYTEPRHRFSRGQASFRLHATVLECAERTQRASARPEQAFGFEQLLIEYETQPSIFLEVKTNFRLHTELKVYGA